MVSLPPGLGYWLAAGLGRIVGDVVLTRDEIRGLMAGLLAVDSPPTGMTRLTDWVRQHAGTVGQRYANELARRRDRRQGYGRA